LALPEVVGEAAMGNDIAEDLQALADELSALPDVRVQHVEVAHILVADVARSRAVVTGPCSTTWCSKELGNEALVAVSHASSEPFPLGLRQWPSCCLVEAVEGSVCEDLELAEAAQLQSFILSPLSLPFSLVGHFEVLGSEQLMWMLCVRVWVIVLVLGDIEALQLHVLLSTG